MDEESWKAGWVNLFWYVLIPLGIKADS